jgi:23S rRNA (cytidine1920-2'-O)/16S rRNA (cytidine1409-2'-O)-methyltransferase
MMAREEKLRLDVLMVELGLAASREQAQRSILAGTVTVDGRPAQKPGTSIARSAAVAVAQPDSRFVGRGGDKLDGALATFDVQVNERICLDVGASTGGFTDCLLQRGASLVYAIDVGHGQLAWKIRSDPRVIAREKVNARYLSVEDFNPRPSLGVADVSFISLELILRPMWEVLIPPREVVCLIKPQFELGRELVPRGGVVRDEALRQMAVDKIERFVHERLNAEWRGVVPSSIQGADGNQEYLSWISE